MPVIFFASVSKGLSLIHIYIKVSKVKMRYRLQRLESASHISTKWYIKYFARIFTID